MDAPGRLRAATTTVPMPLCFVFAVSTMMKSLFVWIRLPLRAFLLV